jgi:hypothetical protein
MTWPLKSAHTKIAHDKVRDDVEFRKDVAKAMGVGFEVPKTLNCSNVPKRTKSVEAVNA